MQRSTAKANEERELIEATFQANFPPEARAGIRRTVWMRPDGLTKIRTSGTMSLRAKAGGVVEDYVPVSI